MSQNIDGNTKSFQAGAAIAANLRVKLTSGKLAVAGLADKEIGTLLDSSFADLDMRSVQLRTASGTCKMVAAEALAAGAVVYTAAGGKVADTATATSYLIGTALEAATADGDVIEVLRNSHGDTASA